MRMQKYAGVRSDRSSWPPLDLFGLSVQELEQRDTPGSDNASADPEVTGQEADPRLFAGDRAALVQLVPQNRDAFQCQIRERRHTNSVLDCATAT
jgi:hypothetical protein